jgi:hypothetical protein
MNINPDSFLYRMPQNGPSPEQPVSPALIRPDAGEPRDKVELNVRVNSDAVLNGGRLKSGALDRFVAGFAGNRICREAARDSIRIGSLIPGAMSFAIKSPVIFVPALFIGLLGGGLIGVYASARVDKWLEGKVIEKISRDKAAEFGKCVDKVIDEKTGELKKPQDKAADEIRVEEEWVNIDGVHLPKKIKNLVHSSLSGLRR